MESWILCLLCIIQYWPAPSAEDLALVHHQKVCIIYGSQKVGVLTRDVLLSTEWRYQNFDHNRYRDFFYNTKFSETKTFFRDQIFPKLKPRLFFPRPNFPKPKLRIFSETKFFQNRNRDFFTKPNFSKLKPKPSKIWQKSRDRDLNRDFSTSFEMKFGKFGTYKQNWNFWDQNLGL